MIDVTITHPYQVRSWFPGAGLNTKHRVVAHWDEHCLCRSQAEAERIATLLFAHQCASIMSVVRFRPGQLLEYVSFYPDRQTVEKETVM